MRNLYSACALTVFSCIACGTLASPGQGDSNLPVGRQGPFRLVTRAELGGDRNCVLSDPSLRYDDPSVVRGTGNSVMLFFTVDNGTSRWISASHLDRPTGVPLAPNGPTVSLRATHPWQGVSVEAPEVLRLSPTEWVMLYASAGGVGVARSVDGERFTADPEPLIIADGSVGETTALKSPTLAPVSPEGFLIAYESAGAVWGALAPRTLRAPVNRLDPDTAAIGRQPLIAPSDDAVDSGVVGFASGSLGDPSLVVETTAIGRELFHLYATARSAPVRSDAGVAPLISLSVAGSFDARHFIRSQTPALRARPDPTVSSPDVLADEPRRTWLYAGGRCDTLGHVRGITVAVAQSDTILPH